MGYIPVGGIGCIVDGGGCIYEPYMGYIPVGGIGCIVDGGGCIYEPYIGGGGRKFG
jgi:hypothetical protein